MVLLALFDETEQHLVTLSPDSPIYAFDDGTHVPADRRVVWCAGCERFAVGEDLSPVARNERQAERWLRIMRPDERTEFLRDALRGLPSHVTEGRKVWLEYLASRRSSAARCLECGSTSLMPVDRRIDYGDWVPHPAKLERVRSRAKVIRGRRRRYYTPEGEVVERRSARGQDGG